MSNIEFKSITMFIIFMMFIITVGFLTFMVIANVDTNYTIYLREIYFK